MYKITKQLTLVPQELTMALLIKEQLKEVTHKNKEISDDETRVRLSQGLVIKKNKRDP